MGHLGCLLPVGFLLLLLTSAVAQGEYAVVHVVSENWSKDYCVLFSSKYVTLPRDLRHAPLLPLHDGTMSPWCPGEGDSHQAQPGSPSQQPLRHTTAMVMRGNCSFYAKGRLAQGRGAHGLLIVSRASSRQCSDTTPAPRDPYKPLPHLTIPMAVLHYTDMLDILSHTRNGSVVHVAMYAPPEPILDYSLLVIFILAVGTVAVGGYWAGLTEVGWLQRRRAQGGGGPGSHRHLEVVAAEVGQEEDDKDVPVDLMPAMTGAVVTMSCSITLLLHFFYDCFVYVMIGIFSLGAGTGLYSCLAPLVHHLPLQRYQWPLPGYWGCLQLPQLLLASLCTAVTVFWVAYRHEDGWAWLLQDTLGVAYCLFILQRLRLPTLKICASLLLALLAFDVFFAFVTPFLTRTGNSRMAEGATGLADSLSHKRLPMVFKVPRISFSALTLCSRPFTILGFGNIVVPGFLVAYCHRFDIQVHSHQVYFMACTLAYAMGLLVTFIATVLTQTSQPTLLFLVSCTLLTSLAVAACRQELTLFWTGQGRAKVPAQPAAGVHAASAADSEQMQEDTVDVQAVSEFEEATDQGAGALDSSPGEDTAEIVTQIVSEDETTGADGPSDSSEAWSDANLDPDELPPTSLGASEGLMPLMPIAMLIPLVPLMPAPSELGHAHAQAQAHEAGLPWTGLHKRKGFKLKKSVSTEAPL
ncbi:signal peptide peptidase-like 2C [Orycteropus afer afer]|uniref:Signal peptide peptidase-like 2C n=1 Tax=Orycteropus afer afer TaxID=1230840 RepID=A0A8B7BCR7_ORYAF|nr:signal peptide peptidase-like 2C [Orycteropus afer afer]